MNEEEVKRETEKLEEGCTSENPITDNAIRLSEEQEADSHSNKKKKFIIAGCLALVVLIAVGFLGANISGNKNQEVQTEERNDVPEITLYGKQLVAGVNVEVGVQEKLIKSIVSKDKLKSVSIELEDATKKADMVVTDIADGKEKLGVPAKSLKFTKEGSYTVVVKAETVEGGKSEVKIKVEVAGELLGYVHGIKDWTVELNAKDVDFMKDVTWDKEKVTEVTADSSKVDLSKEGSYELIYTIKGLDQETSLTKKVDVKVLDEKEAKKEADKGNVVVTTGNEVKKDSKGKAPTGEATTGGTASKPADKPSNGGSASKPADKPVQKPQEPSKPNKPADKPQEPSKPAHTHSWSNVTTTVNHPAEGRNEQYVISNAWTEPGQPIYDMVEKEYCSGCHTDITGWGASASDEHSYNHAVNGEKGGFYTKWIQVQTGTTPSINHPAQYGTRWVETKAAWSETVVTGQKCSCGATK